LTPRWDHSVFLIEKTRKTPNPRSSLGGGAVEAAEAVAVEAAEVVEVAEAVAVEAAEAVAVDKLIFSNFQAARR
jgi:hypothetical protein